MMQLHGPTSLHRQTVLHIIDTLSFAGAQRYVELICRWSSHQHFRHIVCVLQPGTELKEQIEATGSTVVCLNMTRPGIAQLFKIIHYSFSSIREIMRLCRSECVNIVQCHLSDAEFVGITAATLVRIPTIISTIHGPLPLLPPRPWWSLRNVLRRIITILLYIYTDHIVAVSEEVASETHRLFGTPQHKIITLVNRIDTDSFDSPDNTQNIRAPLGLGLEHKVITTTARLVRHKGQNVLISALKLLVPKHEEVRLLLLGDGESRRELHEQCRQLGIANHVSFLGNRSDVRNILAATDIFAFPSLAEGTSLALMEAMAAGKPIVATDIPGNRSLLTHKKNALLVPPGDAPALAEAIATLLEDPATAQNYAAEAKAAVRQHHDIRTTIAGLEKLWQPKGG